MSPTISAPSAPALLVRQRAAAIITHGGRVLLHRLEGDTFWALPGGAIEAGESASEAVARELREELGVELGGAVAMGTLAVVAENFFTSASVAYHEIGLYLHASPLPGTPLAHTPGPYDGVEGAHRLVFAWFAHTELARVDVRPAFLREVLSDYLACPPTGVLHVVHRDTPAPVATSASPLLTL